METNFKKIYKKKLEKIDFFSAHYGDQMSERSQVTQVTLCVQILKWRRRRRQKRQMVFILQDNFLRKSFRVIILCVMCVTIGMYLYPTVQRVCIVQL